MCGLRHVAAKPQWRETSCRRQFLRLWRSQRACGAAITAHGIAAPSTRLDDGSPLFLSARTDESLRALALAYAERLEQAKAVAYYDIAYTAAFHRDRMEKRLAVLPSDAETAAAELRAFAANAPSIRVVAESVIPDNAGIVFVYTGNGTQWHGMGRTLYAESSCFALAMDALDAELQPLLDCSLVEILLGDDPTRLEDTTVSQPLLFAIQMGVTLVLREWGIEPHAVMGHSVGEIAAAWTCGALSFEQALQVIYARSQAQGKTKGMDAWRPWLCPRIKPAT